MSLLPCTVSHASQLLLLALQVSPFYLTISPPFPLDAYVCDSSKSSPSTLPGFSIEFNFDQLSSLGVILATQGRKNFEVGQLVMLIPPEMGNYRDEHLYGDAGGGPLVPGQQEPIELVSDPRVRSALAFPSIFTY